MKTKLNLLKEILIFSLPIITGQIGQMLFGVGDIAVAGRYSSLAVAVIGVAAMVFATFLMMGIGVLLCTGPLASQIRGEGRKDNTFLSNSYSVSFILAVVLTPILFFNNLWIGLLNLNPELTPHVIDYLRWSAFSLWPCLVFQATKEYLQAMGKTYAANGIILFFNAVNILLNIAFMFGKWGIPEMGIVGSALATLICRVLMAVAVFVYMKAVCPFEFKIKAETIKRIFRLGLPISFTLLCEVLMFATVTVLVGGMTLTASASQSLVMNITSLTFMVPMAIGSAVSVLVGEQFGKKSLEGIKNYSQGAIILTILFQLLFATMYLTIPASIISLATGDTAVIGYASALLFWVGLFQIPDGIQVVLAGVMRGLNETKIPMIMGVVSYWIIGLPIGAYFAFSKGLEARGLWMGLAVGLTCMCVLLVVFYDNRVKKLSHLKNN
jgi:MATE family multidrug resistance protein